METRDRKSMVEAVVIATLTAIGTGLVNWSIREAETAAARKREAKKEAAEAKNETKDEARD